MAQAIAGAASSCRSLESSGPSPVLDHMFSVDEPRTGTDGTLLVDGGYREPRLGRRVRARPQGNPASGRMTRPYSIWLSGHYPRALDGLMRILSLDMRVIDPAWIGMKLRKLLDYSEPLGDFMAFVPGERRQQNWPRRSPTSRAW
jgi:ribonucleoside-diphosphate reductase alpha chain